MNIKIYTVNNSTISQNEVDGISINNFKEFYEQLKFFKENEKENFDNNINYIK